MPGPIVVPLDRSALAEEALPLATELGARLPQPLQLTLVHVPIPMLPDGPPVASPDFEARIRGEERTYLEQVRERLAEQCGVVSTPVVLDGPVAPTLIEHARSTGARLVVMTTHGRGGISRMFLGSVADRLIRELHCPVLVVRAGWPGRRLRVGDRRRILIPLDGSDLAEAMIEQVLDLFAGEQITLDVVRVVAPARDFLFSSDAPLISPTKTEAMVLAATRYLNRVAQPLRRLGLRVHTETRVDRSVAGAILASSESRGSDLIALATRGLGGVERMLLGSVADRLVRATRVPLLVWNPPALMAKDILLEREGSASEPSFALATAG